MIAPDTLCALQHPRRTCIIAEVLRFAQPPPSGWQLMLAGICAGQTLPRPKARHMRLLATIIQRLQRCTMHAKTAIRAA